MKKQFLFLFLCLLTYNAYATIRRCNTTGFTGTFTTAQAAYTAASAGDTLHLEPGGNYGALVMTKKLVVIGTGDFIPQNPGYQANQSPGYCSSITISPGAEQTLISCKVSGTLTINCNSLVVTNSSIQTLSIGDNANPRSNIIVSKSIISNVLNLTGFLNNINFSNNYINYINSSSSNYTTSSYNFNYNVIGYPNSPSYINGSIITNNIFILNGGWIGYQYQIYNSTVVNNISSYSTGAISFATGTTGNGNAAGVDLSYVFANYGNFNGDNYQLKSTWYNQNLGMYAGSDPYRPACTPAVPSIYNISAPLQGANNSFNFTISTRSNN